MASVFKLGGLKPLELGKLVLKKISDDEISTRSASLSYYFLLALFPLLIFLVSVVGIIAGPGSELRSRITLSLTTLAPGSASQLVHKVVARTLNSSNAFELAIGIAGALWAASSGTSELIGALDFIYQVRDRRPWWKQKLLSIGLTIALAALILIAIALVLYGGKFAGLVASKTGLGALFIWVWKIVEWPVALAVMFLAFSMLYYFAPDLKERKWHWITPGAVSGVVLWIAVSIGFRFYLHYFNTYNKTYGSIGAVVILMLWLYLTGFAILLGAVMNWIVEARRKDPAELEKEKRQADQQFKAA